MLNHNQAREIDEEEYRETTEQYFLHQSFTQIRNLKSLVGNQFFKQKTNNEQYGLADYRTEKIGKYIADWR